MNILITGGARFYFSQLMKVGMAWLLEICFMTHAFKHLHPQQACPGWTIFGKSSSSQVQPSYVAQRVKTSLTRVPKAILEEKISHEWIH